VTAALKGTYILLEAMLRLRSQVSLGLLVLFLAAHGPVRAQAAPVRTVGARQLVAIAKGGLTAAAQAANGPLDPGQARNRPFWNAVDAMGRSLDAVETALAARSPSFFDTLGGGSRALAELKAVWSHAGVDDPAVRSGLETLSTSYQLLRGSYGWEALRRQQGGDLTADEQRRFQALQQSQAALASRLTALRYQAARAGERQAAADLARLVAQARRIAQAERTLDAYLAAQASAQALEGEWAGDSRSAQPAARKIWKKAAPLIEDLATDSNVGFVFSTDLSKVDGWAPLEAPVEVPADVDLGTEVAGIPLGAAPQGSLFRDEGSDREDGAGVMDDDGGEAEASSPAAPESPSASPATPDEKDAPKAPVPADEKKDEKKKDGKTDEKKDGKTDDGKQEATPAPTPPAPAPPPPLITEEPIR
jgi:hypothetical protein